MKGMPGLAGSLKKRGIQLLHQQCWLWGQDVKRPAGNVLLEYGFERRRPPSDISGCSQYTLPLPEGRWVRLWGFGMLYGEGDGGIYLNRFDFVARAAEGRDCWQAHRLARLRRSDQLHLLPAALQWIARYETEIAHRYGDSYRSSCLTGWQARASEASQVAGAWTALAEAIQRQLDGTDWRPCLRGAMWKKR